MKNQRLVTLLVYVTGVVGAVLRNETSVDDCDLDRGPVSRTEIHPGSAHRLGRLPRVSLVSRNVGSTRAATYRCLLRISSPRTIMSSVPSTSTSHSNFVSIFNSALETYTHKTKKDLTSHPLLPNLQSCNSPEAILTVLREQIPTFSQFQNGDDRLTKWVSPTVNVLHSFSAIFGGCVGLVNIRIFPLEAFLL